MRRSRRVAAGLALAVALALPLAACGKSEPAPQPTWSTRAIAELTTTECYYHNVAKLSHDAIIDLPFLKIGNKKMWIEYSGIVRLGIDAGKVSISGPDADGVVTVAMSQATILGEPDVDEDTIDEALVDTGWFTSITQEEKVKMFSEAQQTMKEAAENDTQLLFDARERAQEIFEQYVKNVGEQLGQTYTVKFVDAE